MNKQEFIERMKSLKNLFGNKSEYVEIDAVIELASELDEPQKVTVPQFVADWIEVCKEHLTSSLYLAMTPSFLKANNQSFELILWIKKKENQEIFALAWINGYEVEKEKRYSVRIKGVDSCFECLYYGMGSNTWSFRMKHESGYFRRSHTRKELEAGGFLEVFNSPLFEVEEVEE